MHVDDESKEKNNASKRLHFKCHVGLFLKRLQYIEKKEYRNET